MYNKKEETLSVKRSLISTFLLIGTMLFKSPKKNTDEEEFIPVVNGILDPEWDGHPIIEPYLKELVGQGYLSQELTGGYAVTSFGQKMALQSTHNTPNFERLAEKSPSTAFAMLFASFKALEKQLAGQNRLIAGNSTQLVDNTRDMLEFFAAKLGLTIIEAEKVAIKSTKKKTKEPVMEITE